MSPSFDAADMMKKLHEAKSFLQSRCANFPPVAVVLGSGLNRLLDSVVKEAEIPFSEIPHVRKATVEGHHGKIVVGTLAGTRMVSILGRLHYYEGYSMPEVVFPFRALGLCGVESFLLTNAAGGLQPGMKVLDLMLIRDHLNLTGANPLIGPNLEELGPRFPDMTYLYDREWCDLVVRTAKNQAIDLKEGVYAGLHGPSFETPAEIKMYRRMGADAAGMSTVAEAIALRHMGKRVAAISFISNLAAGDVDQPLSHQEVIDNARLGYPAFAALVTEVVTEMGRKHAKLSAS